MFSLDKYYRNLINVACCVLTLCGNFQGVFAANSSEDKNIVILPLRNLNSSGQNEFQGVSLIAKQGVAANFKIISEKKNELYQDFDQISFNNESSQESNVNSIPISSEIAISIKLDKSRNSIVSGSFVKRIGRQCFSSLVGKTGLSLINAIANTVYAGKYSVLDVVGLTATNPCTTSLRPYLVAAKARGFNTIAFCVYPNEIKVGRDYYANPGYLWSPGYRKNYIDCYKMILDSNFNLIVRILAQSIYVINADSSRRILWDSTKYFLRNDLQGNAYDAGKINYIKDTTVAWMPTIDFYNVKFRERILNYNNPIVRQVVGDVFKRAIKDVDSVAHACGKAGKVINFTLNATPDGEAEYWYGFFVGNNNAGTYNTLFSSSNNSSAKIDWINQWQDSLGVFHKMLSNIVKNYRDTARLRWSDNGFNHVYGAQFSGPFDKYGLKRGTSDLAKLVNKLDSGDWLCGADIFRRHFPEFNHNFTMDYYSSVGKQKSLVITNEISPFNWSSDGDTVRISDFITQARESYNHGAQALFVNNWTVAEVNDINNRSLMDTIKKLYNTADLYVPQAPKEAVFIDPWSIYKTEDGNHNVSSVYIGIDSILYIKLSQNYVKPVKFVTSPMLELNPNVLDSFNSIHVPAINTVVSDSAYKILSGTKYFNKLRLYSTNVGGQNKYQTTRVGKPLSYKKRCDLLWVDDTNKYPGWTVPPGDVLPDYPGLQVTLSTGSGFTVATLWSGWGGLGTSKKYLIGDFNGDGFDDFCNIAANDSLQVVLSLTPTCQFSGLSRWGKWSVIPKRTFTGDFNGDNKDDLLWFDTTNGRLLVKGSTGSSFSSGLRNWATLGNNLRCKGSYVGDFNGDGRDDFCYLAIGCSLMVALSQIDSTFSSPRNWRLWAADSNRIFVGDYNGDGKDDLLWVDATNKSGAQYPGLQVRLSSGASFDSSTLWCGWGGLQTSKGFYIGDFNGDGFDDFCNFSADYSLEVVISRVPQNDNHFSGLINWGSWGADSNKLFAGNFGVPNGLSKKLADNREETNPDVFQLFQNRPNPFNPITTLRFNIPAKEGKLPTKLQIYNINGQLIRTLVSDVLKPGDHSIVWNGRNEIGRTVPSGVYFYRLRAGDKFVDVKKMVMMK